MNNDKTEYQATLFENRLTKQFKTLKKWARKSRISCYRLYDRDIPEIPVALDIYSFLPADVADKLEAIDYFNTLNAAISANNDTARAMLQAEKDRTYAHLYLYERPYEKDEREEQLWLEAMADKAAKVLEISRDHVILKTRKRQSDAEGHRDQYNKIENTKAIKGIVLEQGQIFYINLTDYIDTGLFFDHRPLRDIVRKECAGKSVLNLFCYTGSFSVYSAEGKAKRVESVDMSKTYLEWAKDNMTLNGFKDADKYVFTRGDVVGFLNQKNAEVKNKEGTNRYDIIILDPPTFSNSKRTDTTLDINRDWSDLVNKCLGILNPNGVLYFSTNSRRLSFDASLVNGAAVDITEKTIPDDYRNNKIHRAWKITESNEY